MGTSSPLLMVTGADPLYICCHNEAVQRQGTAPFHELDYLAAECVSQHQAGNVLHGRLGAVKLCRTDKQSMFRSKQ